MRLVGSPDGSIGRADRALWLTPPFDLTWVSAIGSVGGTANVLRLVGGEPQAARYAGGNVTIARLTGGATDAE